MDIPSGLLDLLKRPALCLIATTNDDGTPQLTQTWADTDGEHIVINTVQGFKKLRNIERDPRVAISILDPEATASYWSVAATVVGSTTEGGVENVEALAQKYLGGPYPWYGGRDQVRVVLTIRVDKIVQQPWG